MTFNRLFLHTFVIFRLSNQTAFLLSSTCPGSSQQTFKTQKTLALVHLLRNLLPPISLHHLDSFKDPLSATSASEKLLFLYSLALKKMIKNKQKLFICKHTVFVLVLIPPSSFSQFLAQQNSNLYHQQFDLLLCSKCASQTTTSEQNPHQKLA